MVMTEIELMKLNAEDLSNEMFCQLFDRFKYQPLMRRHFYPKANTKEKILFLHECMTISNFYKEDAGLFFKQERYYQILSKKEFFQIIIKTPAIPSGGYNAIINNSDLINKYYSPLELDEFKIIKNKLRVAHTIVSHYIKCFRNREILEYTFDEWDYGRIFLLKNFNLKYLIEKEYLILKAIEFSENKVFTNAISYQLTSYYKD